MPNTVTIPPQSPVPFAAAFEANYQGLELLRRLYMLDQLDHFTAVNPGWSSTQLQAAVNRQMVTYDKDVAGLQSPWVAVGVAEADLFQKALNAFAPKELGWMIDPGINAAKDFFGINTLLDADRRTNSQNELSALLDHFGGDATGQIALAFSQCKVSEPCLGALMKIFPELRLGDDKPPDQLKDDLTAGRVVEENQTVFNNQYVTVNVDSGVSVKVDELTAELRERFTTMTDGLNQQFGQILGLLGGIDQDQRDILKWIADQQAQAKHQQEVADAAVITNGILDAARADLAAVVSLASLFDPTLARAVSVLGNAAIRIVEATFKAASQMANLSRVAGSMGSVLATAALAGTVIGAVASVIGLLITMDEPDPDELILQGIQQLQQQIRDLGERMEARFDRIDKTLTVIYQGMVDSFTQVIIQLNHIEGDLVKIGNELRDQAAQLQRIEAAIGNYAVIVARRDLVDAMTAAIGWDARSDVGMTVQEFLGFRSTFGSWGSTTAADEAETGVLNRNYSPDQIATELASTTLDRNLVYVHELTQTLGLGPLFGNGSTCANPLTFSIAANAQAQLQAEQGRLALRLTAPRNADLLATGERIRACQRSVTVDADGHPRTAFFGKVIDHYVAAKSACGDALDAGVARALQDARTARHFEQTVPDPNPWGPPDQSCAYEPARLGSLVGANPLPLPANLARFVPSQLLLLSWFAGAADTSLTATYSADWFPVTPDPHGDSGSAGVDASALIGGGGKGGGGGGGGGTENYKRGVAVVITHSDGSGSRTPIASWSTSYGPTFSTNGGPPSAKETPEQSVHANWTQGEMLQDRLLAGLGPAPEAAGLVARITPQLSQLIDSLRDQARAEASSALAEQFVLVEGARQLLASVVEVGMPRSLPQDDLLNTLLHADPPPPPARPPTPGDPPPADPPLGNGIPGAAALSVWWGAPDTDATPPPSHYRTIIDAVGAEHVQLLRDRVTQHLEDSGERDADTFRNVDDALAALAVSDFLTDSHNADIGDLMPTTLPILEIGSEGTSVKRLQSLVIANTAGLTVRQLPIDGSFGPVTEKYVKAFQSAAGLANAQGPSGIVDALTWRGLLGIV